jgi:quinol monooxygenase YgiN
MIVEYTRYLISPERRKEFEAMYREAQKYLRDSEHCEAYELTHSIEEPDHYILRIEWNSVDGHLKGFRMAPSFKEFFALVQPFVKDIQEMKHYEVLSDVVITREQRTGHLRSASAGLASQG